MLTLPVSGAAVALRNPDGMDDLLLVEAMDHPVEIGIELLARLGGAALDAPGLVITDFEFLLLQVRAARFGQAMALGFTCPHCRALAEIDIQVANYIAEARPRIVPGITPHPSRAGWFCLAEAGFRLPTVGDQATVAGQSRPEHQLAAMCLDETARKPPHRARVERAMEAMAPALSRSIAGDCPWCGTPVQVALAVAPLVIGELKRAAGAVHDEVNLIASTYHWSEARILSLPQPRRRAYAERIRHAQPRAA